jgi:hypothetical protein
MLRQTPTRRTAMPQSNLNTILDQLAEEWLVAKDAERQANAERVNIEERILELVPPKEEGVSYRKLGNSYRIKSTGKLSYKADLDKLTPLVKDWEIKPIKIEIKADEAMLKHIRANCPDLWRVIAIAVTTKPSKTAVTIEETTDDV